MPLRLLLTALLYCIAVSVAHGAPQLNTHPFSEGARPDLDNRQLRWLWERRTLRLGVIDRENPPFEILGTGLSFEGITADYASLLAAQLRLQVKVKVYTSLDGAIKGLREGDIDLLGSMTLEQAKAQGLRLSRPYVSDAPTLLAPSVRAPLDTTQAVRLAMVDGYRAPDQVEAAFPQAQLQTFPSPASALAALSLGQADLYLGSALGVRYVLGRNESGGFEEVGRASLPEQMLGFAMAEGASPLADLIDIALDSLSVSQRLEVSKRWRPTLIDSHHPEPLQLSVAEQLWLRDNPRVTVLADEHLVPLSYHDANGNWRGMSLDILQLIERRTGLQFDVRPGGTIERMIDQLRQGQAQLIAGLPDSPGRRRYLSFSRAYLSAPRVLVTRDEPQAPTALAQLQGQRLALVQGSAVQDELRQHHPKLRQLNVATPLDALHAVAKGKAAAAVLSLDDARPLIIRWYLGRLKIGASLALPPVHFALASLRGATELQGIINKAMFSLAPQEIDALVRRWRNPMIVADGNWPRYRAKVMAGFAVIVVLLAMALLWVRYLRRLHLQLRGAKQDAEQANQAKTHFLATMSHEIRTPLHAVQGMLELAQRKAAQGVLDRLAIEVASDAARGLLELIGDILDITRIESGHLQLVLERVRLDEQVARVVQLFAQQAKGKGLELLLDTQGPVDTQVMLDPLRFKQVLANLLSNAVKFTAQGHVRVWVRALQDETRLLVEVHVEDTGIGIDAAELDALGQPFRQASNQRQSARCSAGLGLGISRSLCQMMGGDLKLHSVLGQGTRVELNLDLALAPERDQALPANAPPDLAGELRLRVLVVDDYPANRLLLAQQLDFLGHHARVAEDGSQALRLWLKEHFDVVISDCNMPQLNGYALARAIREHERRSGRSRCRLIGLTASAMTRERRRCRAVGMDDCLFKPLGLDSLQRALADGMRQQNAEQPMLDLEHLQRLVNRDQAALKALLGDLRSSNREDLQRLEAVGNDASALAELAHRVKGGARIARADRLYDRCEQLERSCAAQPLDVERLRSDVQALRRMMMQLEHQLARMPTHGFPG
ncbi:transporter substrate-binding domain-containing protein [Pseudomonas putida]|uniref:histidine kinase n=2 Tax=Pseudomonas TaxID=286 RepID=A0A6S5TW82_PSEPU|nr:transporter substrate-binding domain-containing protein [Pseudomonas putida]BBT41486.1 two-component system sensor histidine kinase/response regulator [Pseudomonas putida]